jgi:hypothetical protein
MPNRRALLQCLSDACIIPAARPDATSEPKPYEINELLLSFDSEARKTKVLQNDATSKIGARAARLACTRT